jgi:hypothetical protein
LGVQDDDEDDDAVTVPDEPVRERVIRMSNAHIELMLIHVLGPSSDTEATNVLRRTRMSDDPPFTKLYAATSYVQEWKVAMRWCRQYLPREKVLIKFFLAKVKPKQLAYDIENSGLRRMDDIFKRFVMDYRKGVSAKKLLTGMEVLSDTPSGREPVKKKVTFGTQAASTDDTKPKAETGGTIIG